MTSLSPLRSGTSSFVNSAKPSTRFGSPARIRVEASPATYAFVHFGLPAVLTGKTILSAELHVQMAAGYNGSVTHTARAVGENWPVSKLTYNNRPAQDAAAVNHNVTLAAAAANDIVAWNVTDDVQAYVSGSRRNYGWRLTTSSANALYYWGFTAAKYKPSLVISYTTAPAAPTDLTPSSAAVGIPNPVLQWTAEDPTKAQVQVDPSANGAVPAYDSGWVTATGNQFDLARTDLATTYGGLANGAVTQWRVRVQGDLDSSASSPWSQWATFSRVDKDPFTFVSPTTTVSDSSPVIVWSFPNQTAYRIWITKANNPTKTLWDSGRTAGADQSLTVDKDVLTTEGTVYTIHGRGWGTIDRGGTPGDPEYSQTTVNVTLTYDATVTAVTSFTAAQASPAPWVDLTWQRATIPDTWAIFRNGVLVERVAAAEDLMTDPGSGGSGSSAVIPQTIPFTIGATGGGGGGTAPSFAFRDYTADPNRTHVYRVAAITNSKTASTGPTQTVALTGVGIWLADPDTGDDVVLWGDNAVTWVQGEDAVVHNPIGATSSVRIITGMRGVEDSDIAGLLADTSVAPAHTADVCESRLWSFKEQAAKSNFRLAIGDRNIPVRLQNVNQTPDPLTRNGARVVNVTMQVTQTAEMPFTIDRTTTPAGSVATDTDGIPYWAGGTGSGLVLADTDGVPYVT